MKKYFLRAIYLDNRNTLLLHSKKDFRKCKQVELKGRRLLVVSPERIVDLTDATIVLMGKEYKSFD
ncbi:hypothetical protein [Rummeliibacillus pycnus]|uniref:hypothetical protein n=1 Tax=Rummeliibacillus pycnus TaxID=101070 RepID=UPI000C9AF30F|nr:hypothetical protein [Rummeliibacillus pycnus]